MRAAPPVVRALLDFEPISRDSITVAAARTAGAVVVHAQFDVTERTSAFNHKPDGPLRLLVQHAADGCLLLLRPKLDAGPIVVVCGLHGYCTTESFQ